MTPGSRFLTPRRQFFHSWGGGEGEGLRGAGMVFGSNTKDGERWGTADEAHLLLCSPVRNRQRTRGLGTPILRRLLGGASRNRTKGELRGPRIRSSEEPGSREPWIRDPWSQPEMLESVAQIPLFAEIWANRGDFWNS